MSDNSQTQPTDTRAGPVYVEHLRLALASLDASRAFLVREPESATGGAAHGPASALRGVPGTDAPIYNSGPEGVASSDRPAAIDVDGRRS